ncbi:MAG: hypothetical protein MUC96_37085, partial [Myxococcaceae bacterium]|nr:hypothetical protein [Myxococcaceae bacterium]
GRGESMFAIASSPGSTTFDYLIRRGAGVSEALATLTEGSEVEVTPPEGPGFPIGEARGQDVLFVCTGTALAPCRSALGLIARSRADFGRVTLVQGQRSPRQLPWLVELSGLPGVELVTVVTEGGAGWTGPVRRSAESCVSQPLSIVPSRFFRGAERVWFPPSWRTSSRTASSTVPWARCCSHLMGSG